MLTCRDATDLASDHVDGELGLRDRLSLRSHLLLCRHCRRFHRQFRLLVGSLRHRHYGVAVPEAFVDRVLGRLEADPPAGPQRPSAPG
jgi:anti-sigma factor ChrR (cupin superfamily)